MKHCLLLCAALLSGAALADHTTDNLTPFEAVCINASYYEGEQDNDDVAGIIVDAMYDQLDAAGIAVADSPCQPKGLLGNKQLNLYFSFDSTEEGDAYSVGLTGWLDQDGPFKSVDVWTTGRFGSLKADTGQAKALTLLSSTLGEFVKEWQKAHPAPTP